MRLSLETNRLNLRVATIEDAQKVAMFLSRNKEIIEKYEAIKPENYYEIEYQEKLIEAELKATLEFNYLRYYVFKKNNPNIIIGTVSFGNIIKEPYLCCNIGYKFDLLFQRQGYATEAIQASLDVVFEEFRLHRVEAYIMEDNIASISLVNKLGFEYEGKAKKNIRVAGVWEDHLRFAKISDPSIVDKNN